MPWALEHLFDKIVLAPYTQGGKEWCLQSILGKNILKGGKNSRTGQAAKVCGGGQLRHRVSA